MCKNDPDDHESEVTAGRCIRYYDTGDGYLVIRVRMEYHPKFDRWFPIHHELIGVSNVEDQSVVQEILEELSRKSQSVENLPEFSLDHIESLDQFGKGEPPK